LVILARLAAVIFSSWLERLPELWREALGCSLFNPVVNPGLPEMQELVSARSAAQWGWGTKRLCTFMHRDSDRRPFSVHKNEKTRELRNKIFIQPWAKARAPARVGEFFRKVV